MKRKGIWIVISVLAVLGLLMGGFGCAPAGEVTPEDVTPDVVVIPEDAEPIYIGGIYSLTGPIAPIGEGQLAAAQLAIKEINEAGGLLGRPVELIVRDAKGYIEADPTPAYCEEWIDKYNVLYVTGGLCDYICVSAKAHTVWRGTPFLSIDSADPTDLRGEFIHPYQFNGWFNPDWFSFCTYPYLLVNELAPKKWVTVGPDYVWGWGCEASAENAIEQYGGEVIKKILTPLPTTKFDAYIAQIEGLAPEGCGITFGNAATESVAWAKAVYDARLLEKGYVITSSALDMTTVHGAIPPEQIAGVWAGVPQWYYGVKGDPTLKDFVTRYYNEYGELPAGYSSFDYLVNRFALETINEVGTLDPAVWTAAMKGVQVDIIDESEKSFSPVNGALVRQGNLYRFKQPEDMVVDLFPGIPEVGPDWDHMELIYTFPIDYVKAIVPDELTIAGVEVGDPRIGAGVRAYWEAYCEEHGLEMPPNLR